MNGFDITNKRFSIAENSGKDALRPHMERYAPLRDLPSVGEALQQQLFFVVKEAQADAGGFRGFGIIEAESGNEITNGKSPSSDGTSPT